MRLFAAVVPPPDVTDELAAEVDLLRSLPGAGGLRWTDRPGWHYTLAFYGEVDDTLVPELSDRLARAARHTEPFALAVSGGGQFGRGQVLWAGASGDLESLGRLADRVEAAARRAGLPMGEHRRYKAHLTVARSRDAMGHRRSSRAHGRDAEARGRDAVDVRPYVAALAGFSSRTWTVADLALIRSNLPKSGVPGEQPRYEVVARWRLGGAG
jgi:2'-5' RNA ligase